MPPPKLTPEIINAAIEGFEQQKLRIDAQIAELRAMLTGAPTATEPATIPEGQEGRRRMSAATRQRMADAQRKRWADSKKKPAPSSPVAEKPKRKLSAAGKKAIGDATRKRWARAKAEAATMAKGVAKKAPVKASGKAAKTGAAKRQQKAATAATE